MHHLQLEERGLIMKVETVMLAGQVRPWGILVDGRLDCDLGQHQREGSAALLGANKYGVKVLTTADPEHYSNQSPGWKVK
jgi:hypothetical protein